MGKVGKRIKKENGNLVVENNFLEEELIRLKDELDSVKKEQMLF